MPDFYTSVFLSTLFFKVPFLGKWVRMRPSQFLPPVIGSDSFHPSLPLPFPLARVSTKKVSRPPTAPYLFPPPLSGRIFQGKFDSFHASFMRFCLFSLAHMPQKRIRKIFFVSRKSNENKTNFQDSSSRPLTLVSPGLRLSPPPPGEIFHAHDWGERGRGGSRLRKIPLFWTWQRVKKGGRGKRKEKQVSHCGRGSIDRCCPKESHIRNITQDKVRCVSRKFFFPKNSFSGSQSSVTR